MIVRARSDLCMLCTQIYKKDTRLSLALERERPCILPASRHSIQLGIQEAR
jgi:hypothetical protein